MGAKLLYLRYQGYIHERHMYVQQSQWIKFSAFYGQSGKPEDVLAALQGIAEVAIKAPETSKLLEKLERRATIDGSAGAKRTHRLTKLLGGGERASNDGEHETGLAMVTVRVGSDTEESPEEEESRARDQSRPSGDAVLGKPGKRKSITRYTSDPEVVRRHVSAAKHPHLTRVRFVVQGFYCTNFANTHARAHTKPEELRSILNGVCRCRSVPRRPVATPLK